MRTTALPILLERLRDEDEIRIPISALHGLDLADLIEDGLVVVVHADDHNGPAIQANATSLFRGLKELNGLSPLDAPLPKGFVPVGLWGDNSWQVPVVWVRDPASTLSHTCVGIRTDLGRDSIIALVGRVPSTHWIEHHRVAIIPLPDDCDGNLQLARGLDMLDPGRKRRREMETIPQLDLVRLEFATSPSRHILRINGHEQPWFAQCDVMFARMLVLAARRAHGYVGHVQKEKLLDGNRGQVESLRYELARYPHPDLSQKQLRWLIECNGGRVRLVPSVIYFDESLTAIQLVEPHMVRMHKLQPKKAAQKRADYQRAVALLVTAAKFGAPLPKDLASLLPRLPG